MRPFVGGLCLLLGFAFAEVAHAQFPATTARPGRVRGVIFDSLLNAPLRDATATIVLPKGNRSARSDSTGRFLLDSIPPGTYLVGVHAPVLDSLDISDRTTTVQVFSGTTVPAFLATPSIQSLQEMYCPDTVSNRAPTVAFGRVRTPTAGRRVVVNVDWREPPRPEYRGSPALHVVQRDESQLWSACGMPLDSWVIVTARDSAVVGRAIFNLGARGAVSSDINVRPGSHSITGRVIDHAGRPVAEARVSVVDSDRATSTGSLGTFVLDSVPLATFTLDVRQAGYRPSLVVVNGDGDPAPITLSRTSPSGDAMVGSDRLRFILRHSPTSAPHADGVAATEMLDRLLSEHAAESLQWWVDGLPADAAFARTHRGAALRGIEFYADGATAPVAWRQPGRGVLMLWTAGADW